MLYVLFSGMVCSSVESQAVPSLFRIILPNPFPVSALDSTSALCLQGPEPCPVPTTPAVAFPSLLPPWTPSPLLGPWIRVLPGCHVLGPTQAVLNNLPAYPTKIKNPVIPHGHFRGSILPWQVSSFYESPATILFYLSEARRKWNGRNLLQMSTSLGF